MTDHAVLEVDVDGPPTTADELLDMIRANRPAWWADAACRGQTDVMWPKSTGRPGVRGTAVDWSAAKALCAVCPVIDRCAEAGRNERHGIWGGVVRTNRMPRTSRRVTKVDAETVVRAIGRDRAVTPGELASRLAVTTRSGWRWIAALEADGLLARTGVGEWRLVDA